VRNKTRRYWQRKDGWKRYIWEGPGMAVDRRVLGSYGSMIFKPARPDRGHVCSARCTDWYWFSSCRLLVLRTTRTGG
jgi:hypothetical protein